MTEPTPIKVYLDDNIFERQTPRGWVRVVDAQSAIFLLQTGVVEEISLDYDLSVSEPTGRVGDGVVVALWIAEAAKAGTMPPLKWSVHSESMAAWRVRQAMEAADLAWGASR